MTKEELLEKFHELQTCCDTEIAHGVADQLLLEYINDQEITEAYHAIPKWYA